MNYYQLEHNRCLLFDLLTEQKSILEQLISDLKLKTRKSSPKCGVNSFV